MSQASSVTVFYPVLEYYMPSVVTLLLGNQAWNSPVFSKSPSCAQSKEYLPSSTSSRPPPIWKHLPTSLCGPIWKHCKESPCSLRPKTLWK